MSIALLLSVTGQAASLTGAIAFGIDASGNYQPTLIIGGTARNDAWNTVGGDVPYNLYLTLSGVALNTGNGPETGINLPLVAGSEYDVSLAMEAPFAANGFGLNLFFDAQSGTPGISATGSYFVPVGSPPFPPAPFSANSAPSTADLFGSFVPGAGTTVYDTAGLRVELSALEFDATLGQYTSAYSPIPGDNAPDATGHFVLVVTSDVPEPRTFGLVSGFTIFAAAFITCRASVRSTVHTPTQ